MKKRRKRDEWKRRKVSKGQDLGDERKKEEKG